MNPYTYFLFHIPTQKAYYGARWANDCHPNDLWRKYFTSSPIIKDLIISYGKDSFYYEIRKVFNSKEEAILWESKVLRRLKIKTNDKWLNRGYTINNHVSLDFNQDIRDKISSKLKGRKLPDWHIEKCRQGNLGKKRTEEQRKNFSELQKAAGGYGPKKHKPESVEKIKEKITGLTRTEETKKKLSEHAKKREEEKRRNGFKMPEEGVIKRADALRGKPRSEETKKKIKEGCKNRGSRIRLPNGQLVWESSINQQDQ